MLHNIRKLIYLRFISYLLIVNVEQRMDEYYKPKNPAGVFDHLNVRILFCVTRKIFVLVHAKNNKCTINVLMKENLYSENQLKQKENCN